MFETILLNIPVIAPALEDCPKLVGPEVVNENYVYFYCDLPHNYTDNLAAFDITFAFNGEVVEGLDMVTTASGRVALHEKSLHGQLGKWVKVSFLNFVFTVTIYFLCYIDLFCSVFAEDSLDCGSHIVIMSQATICGVLS